MEDYRMAVIHDKDEIAKSEMANFILLSLYREYSKALLNNPINKNVYINKMKQIKYDIQHLKGDALLEKVRTSYHPALKNFTYKL